MFTSVSFANIASVIVLIYCFIEIAFGLKLDENLGKYYCYECDRRIYLSMSV